jgi:HEAT repeat protein
MTGIELSVAALLLGGYAVFLGVLFTVLAARATRARQQAAASQAAVPEIRDALVDYLAGSNDQTHIREFVSTHRSEVGNALISFKDTVGGSARDRLCDLALDLALVHDWGEETHSREPAVRRAAYARLAFVCVYEPCQRVVGDLVTRALRDPDPGVRLSAARALIQSGNIAEVGDVFELAASNNLLVRIMLTEDLRRYATELCALTVPSIFKSGDLKRILATLEILVAWERALPLEDLAELLDHRDRKIRVAALRLVPLIPPTAENQRAVLRELTDNDPDVSTAAALTAGRLRLQEAMPSLARCVRTGAAELARMAATAMAAMPPQGWDTLEELASGPNPAAAFIASGALQKAKRKAGA